MTAIKAPHSQPKVEDLSRLHDADGNKRVSQTELKEGREIFANLDRLDGDQDGHVDLTKLNPEELSFKQARALGKAASYSRKVSQRKAGGFFVVRIFKRLVFGIDKTKQQLANNLTEFLVGLPEGKYKTVVKSAAENRAKEALRAREYDKAAEHFKIASAQEPSDEPLKLWAVATDLAADRGKVESTIDKLREKDSVGATDFHAYLENDLQKIADGMAQLARLKEEDARAILQTKHAKRIVKSLVGLSKDLKALNKKNDGFLRFHPAFHQFNGMLSDIIQLTKRDIPYVPVL